MAGYSDTYGDIFVADPVTPATPTGIPVIPPMPAGHVATAADMTALAYACTFLLTKPFARVHDGAGGLAIGTSSTTIPFNTKDIDTSGMWSSGSNTRLTVQTPGWYKFSYSVVTTGSGRTINAKIESTTGANNPAGSGVNSSEMWAGYSVTGGTPASGAGCSGIWPFYLYVGDYLTVNAQADATGNSTDIATVPSFFELEFVST